MLVLSLSNMKKILLTILFTLVLSGGSSADEISDYEIAGAKLNISIVEIMTVDEITENIIAKDNRDPRYTHIKYTPDVSKYSDLEFDEYVLTVDTEDDIFPIVSVSAIIYFNDFNECLKKQSSYANRFERLFKIKKSAYPVQDFSARYGPGSKWRAIVFEKPDYKVVKSDTASVLCYHYGDKSYQDNLKLNILARDYANAITVN